MLFQQSSSARLTWLLFMLEIYKYGPYASPVPTRFAVSDTAEGIEVGGPALPGGLVPGTQFTVSDSAEGIEVIP